jgi:hypothetical protein
MFSVVLCTVSIPNILALRATFCPCVIAWKKDVFSCCTDVESTALRCYYLLCLFSVLI